MAPPLPFSASDNRSLISATSNAAGPSRPYAPPPPHDAAALGVAPAHQHPSYAAHQVDGRHAATEMSYLTHGQAHIPLGGTRPGPPNQEGTTHVSQAYHHNSMPFRDPYSQLQPVTMYSSSEDSALSAYPSKFSGHTFADARPDGSHSSISRSPPAQQDSLPRGNDAQASTSKAAQKRREKPRIELAPDQPLTTQGKARARVYVACVQCRTRKIRCDGAKPICLHCSRRAATNPDDSTPCSYDAAPKRRGPDKNPGSRQRISAPESSNGGKVPRRRRRPTGPSDKSIPMTADVPSEPVVGSGDGEEPGPGVPQPEAHSVDPLFGLDALAQTQAPSGSGASARNVRMQEIYRVPQQRVAGRVEDLDPTPVTHVPSLRGITRPPAELQRVVTVSDPQYSHSQVATQISPVYYSPASPVGGHAYPNYGAAPRSAGSHGSPEYEYGDEREHPDIGAEPSLQLTRDSWWDALLSLYSQHANPQFTGGSLTPGLREEMSHQVTQDLRFLFRASNYWFAFFNVPRFFSRLCDSSKRRSLQPSLILAALAAANFIRSSEQEHGESGRTWALTLLEHAQASLESSINGQWIDESLVQASWLIAFFEISAHPRHNTLRVRGALSMLDSLVRSLAMSALDQNDGRVSRFAPRAVPAIAAPEAYPPAPPAAHAWESRPVPGQSPVSPHTHTYARAGECVCGAYTLGNNWSHAQEHTPLWLMTPAWNEEASDAEVRKEECRRLVWSAVMMVAGYTSFTAANNVPPTLNLFLMEPSNYALLFPGEGLMRGDPSSKETVWALYMRTMLLWHSCVRMRWDDSRPDPEKAQFAVAAWLEIDKVEKALDGHTCGVERAFLFQGREYLFNSRMCISFEFQKYIPAVNANVNMAFHRQKAEEWLRHQASIAKRTMFGLQTITGQPAVTLARRPFFGFWFMSQVSRALLLWHCDRSLTVALEVAKALLGPIEYLMAMWPCSEQRKRYHDLRHNLDSACFAAGVAPPSPPRPELRSALPQ